MTTADLRDVAAKWWAPDPSIVAKLPRGGNKDKTSWQSCSVCGGWHARNAIHLDYVGHSDLTRALIEIDPEWQWEPVAFDEEGLPRVTQRGGMLVLWGRVTLLGKTMLAVGTCEVTKTDADKELVGDMLRNGGMRFGIFGALWSKTDGWHDDDAHSVDLPKGGGDDLPLLTPTVDGRVPTEPVHLPTVPISQPDKPLAAMTVAELIAFARENGVSVSGSKSDIVRTLLPLVRSATGEEPFELPARDAQPAEVVDDRPEFSPVLAGAATVRRGVDSAIKADR
jgi:hypothetical protein